MSHKITDTDSVDGDDFDEEESVHARVPRSVRAAEQTPVRTCLWLSLRLLGRKAEDACVYIFACAAMGLANSFAASCNAHEGNDPWRCHEAGVALAVLLALGLYVLDLSLQVLFFLAGVTDPERTCSRGHRAQRVVLAVACLLTVAALALAAHHSCGQPGGKDDPNCDIVGQVGDAIELAP